MLIKLLPNQVSENWEPIKTAILKSLPPGSESTKTEQILQSFLNEEIQCWFYYDKNEILRSILTTYIIDDKITGDKNLFIFTLFGIDISKSDWLWGLKTLVKYAKGQNCNSILAYTKVQSIIDFTKKVGGNSDFTLLNLPIKTEG